MSTTSVVYNLIGKDGASKAFNSAGNSAGKLEKTVGRVGKAVAKAGALIGVVGIAEFGAHALKAAANYQSAMTLLVTAGGENKKALDMVSKGVQSIAVATGTSTSQLAEGMYTVEKAGFRGANGLNVLRVSAQAAKAENVDLSVMTNAVTSAMTSYHIPANKAVTITNEMVAAAGAAKTTMSEYASSLSTVLPIASAAGISFAQVGGAIATLTNHGTSAKEATQELANTIRNLQAPNNVAVNEMAQLGISSNDVSTKLGKRGLTGTLEYLSETVLKKMGKSGTVLLNTFNASKLAASDANTMFTALPPKAQKVAKAYEGGSLSLNGYRQALKKLPADQAALAQQWATTENKSKGFNSALRAGGQPAQTYTAAIKAMTGGANGLNTTLQLTGENTGRFNANVKAVTDASKHAGKNISTWAATQKTFNVQWDRFKTGVDVAGIKVGALLLGPLTHLLSFFIDDLAPVAGNIGKVIGKGFSAVGGVVSTALRPAKKAVSGFWTGFTTGADALAYPPAGLTKLGVNIRGKFQSLKTAAGGFWTGLTTGAAALAYPPTGLTKFGVNIRTKFQSLSSDASDFWTGLSTTPSSLSTTPTGLTKFGSNVRSKLADLGKSASNFWDNLTAGTPDLSKGSGFLDLSKNLGKAISKAVSGVAINVGGGAQSLVKGLGKAFTSIDWLAVGAFVGKQAVPFIIGFIANLLDPVTIVKSIAKHPMDWVTALASFLVVGKFAGAIVKVLDRIPILRMFSPLFRGLEKLTGPINDAIGKGFSAIGSGFKSAFTKEFPKAAAWLSDHFGGGLVKVFDGSRLKVMYAVEKVGGWITTGLSKGAEAVGTGIIKIGKAIVSPFSKSGGWLLGKGGEIVGGLLRGASSKFASVMGWFGRIKDLLVGNFKANASWLVDKGSGIISGLWNGITRRWAPIGKWLGGMASRIAAPFKSAGSWLVSRGSSVLGGLWNGISTRFVAIGKWFSGMGSRLAGYFKGGSTWLTSTGSSIAGGLMAGLAAGFVGLKSLFLTPINWIINNVIRPFMGALSHIPGLGDLKNHLPTQIGQTQNQLDGGTREGGVVARKKGGPIAPHGLAWVGEEGPELIRVAGRAMVYPHRTSLQMAKQFGQIPGYALGGIIQGAKIAGSGALGEAAKAARAAASHIPGIAVFKTVADSVINTALGWAQSKLQADAKKSAASGGSSAHGDMSAHSASAAKAQSYAKSLLSSFGWAANQMSSLISLWNGESGWNNLAANPTSTAFGIAQFLNGTWAGKKFPKTTNFMQQVYDGFQYIKGSYGSPSKAYSSWLSRSPHWYSRGGKPKAGELAWVGEEGPELVKFDGPAQVWPHQQSMAMARGRGKIPGLASGGKIGSGTKDSAKAYVSHLTAEIKLSSTSTDIRKFTQDILNKIAKTKYSAAQRAFLNNFVVDAENTALKKQGTAQASFGTKLIQGILASFGGASTTSSINTATKSVISRLDQAFTGSKRSGLVNYTERVNGQMEKLAAARDKIAAKISAANDLSTSVTSGAKDFASISGLTLGSTKTLSREFRSKLASISNFAKNIATLKRKGFSSELIAQLLAEGIDQAAPMAEQLIKATPAQVHSFNGTQRAIDRTAQKLGVVAVNAQFGKSAATNFVASLRSQENSLERQMRALAKVFARGVGHAFHIKGYARGGRFAANQLAVVGEEGPEVVKFGTAGTVYPNVGPRPIAATSSNSVSSPELAEIRDLLKQYVGADHTTVVQLDRKVLARAVNNQNLRTGPGSRVGRKLL